MSLVQRSNEFMEVYIDNKERLESDNILSDTVLQKYHLSSAIANGKRIDLSKMSRMLNLLFIQSEAMEQALTTAVIGVSVASVCRQVDQFILDQTAKVFAKKG
jgi:hypothetical protein